MSDDHSNESWRERHAAALVALACGVLLLLLIVLQVSC